MIDSVADEELCQYNGIFNAVLIICGELSETQQKMRQQIANADQ